MMAFGTMALFGVAYIVSSGAFLSWGIALFSDRPDFGLGLPFLMIALGPTAGAPLFGTVWDAAGSGAALLSFAAIMGSAAFWIPNAALIRKQESAPPLNMLSSPRGQLLPLKGGEVGLVE
jgi:predicted MFS family arabinose efflux permease